MPKRSARERLVHDGISGCRADLHAYATASAGIAIDLWAAYIVLGDRAVDWALIDAKLARLPLIGEARHRIDSSGGHGQWKFLAKHPGLAGGNTWCVDAHDACLPDGLDDRVFPLAAHQPRVAPRQLHWEGKP